MTRHIFPEDRMHAVARDKVAAHHSDLIEEVQAAVEAGGVVVVGIAMSPPSGNARKLLKKKGVPFTYLEYGGYHGPWRRRNALKMWTGWPTFPMVFVKGTFVGGASNLAKLDEGGELDTLLK